jgi:class 3 adenylate cyclase/tetratricopeptide (TPR) repeat protein
MVTVVFTDVAGSTSLGEQIDAEAVRRVMERYFAEMRSVLEGHGGTVEKFIGDAVMAVFGAPIVHEDDALRAVRAASEMRKRLAVLNADLERLHGVTLAVRTGISTGEVVAGDTSGGEFFATGDAVNVAARLEQAAQPGEVLLADQTHLIVQSAVRVEAVEPMTLKGKADAVGAYRLLEVVEGAPALTRRFDTPFVGRQEELTRVLGCFDRSVEGQTPVLVTVLGAAGLGKTRLAAELIAKIEERATVLQGRCLSYGEGITFWPLQEIVRSLGERPAGAPDPEEARSTEETFWAYRKLFEALARVRPLVLVLEDIHWAEPTLLDLVEHIVEWTQDAPITVVCLARPELVDDRPGWSGERLELESLADEEARTLVAALAAEVDQSVRVRALEVAEGNPLFLEQLLVLATEEGSQFAVPDTIQALLAARLDCLGPEERSLLERGAVIGKEFWRGAVLHLSPHDTQVSALLQGLIRRRLIRPERSSLPGHDAFRFHHGLVQEAVYAATSKAVRADLHERFADWLENEDSPYVEIIGYHLEQAYGYLAELGPIDEEAERLATRAAGHLSSAGRGATARGDVGAAVNLFGRASVLYRADDARRLELAPELAGALFELGRLADAEHVLQQSADEAGRLGYEPLRLLAEMELAEQKIQTDPTISLDDALALAEQSIPLFESSRHDRGLWRAWELIRDVCFVRGQLEDSRQAAEQALGHAERTGDIRLQAEERSGMAGAAFWGYAPLRECVSILERNLEWSRRVGMRTLEGMTLARLGRLRAEEGQVGEGLAMNSRGREIIDELGLKLVGASHAGEISSLARLETDPLLEELVHGAYETLKAAEEKGTLSTVAANLAQVLYAKEDYERAEQLTLEAETISARDDAVTQVGWRTVRAMVLARRGQIAEAETHAREGIEIAAATEYCDCLAKGFLSLGEVLRLAARNGEAEDAIREAIHLYEAKGFKLSADAARNRLREVQAPQDPRNKTPADSPGRFGDEARAIPKTPG